MAEEKREQAKPILAHVYYDEFTDRIRGGLSAGEAHIYASHKKYLARGYKGSGKTVELIHHSKFKTWAAMALLVLTLMLVGWASTNSPHIIIELAIFIVGIGWTFVFYSLLKKQTWWLTHAKEDFWNLPDTLKATEP